MSSGKTFSQSPNQEEQEQLLHPAVFPLSNLLHLGAAKAAKGWMWAAASPWDSVALR